MTAINSFTGWMWNDETLLGENQFVYSENIDIYRDPTKIQLATLPVNYKTALPWFVSLIADSWADIDSTYENQIYFALENKDIIDALGTTRFDGSTARPIATYNSWRGFMFFDSAVVFFDQSGWIFVPFRVTAPAASPTWDRDNVAHAQDWTTNYAYDLVGITSQWVLRPTYTIGDAQFFTDNADHYNIDVTSSSWWMAWAGVFWPWYSTITKYEQWISQPWYVVFASVHSDGIWTGSTSSARNYSELSAVSVVAGVSSEWVKQLQTDKYTKFLHWVNYNNTDLLIGGDIREYTNTSGYELAEYAAVYIYNHLGFGAGGQQLLAKSRYYPNLATAFNSPWVTHYLVGEYGQTNYNWALINDMLYCISTFDGYSVIYGYGREVWWVDIGFSVVVSRNSSGKRMTRIGCLYRNRAKNGFYYSYEDEDGVFGIDYYDDIVMTTPTAYQPSGKIFLRSDEWWDLSIKKEVKNLKIWCEVPEDTSIIISYILDDGAEVTYATITPTTQGTSVFKTYRWDKPIKWFQKISWFAELTTTGIYTPSISNFNYELAAIQV